VWPGTANFLLLRHEAVDLRRRLLADGLAVRRADTFPGLDAAFARVAVLPDPVVRERLVAALRGIGPG
jgi:histidinol-phosphate aminotransferase